MLWKFKALPIGYWNRYRDDKFELVKWLSSELKINNLDDWYRVSSEQILRIAPLRGLLNSGNFALLLKNTYPDHNWVMEKLQGLWFSDILRLTKALNKLFPKIFWSKLSFDKMGEKLGIKELSDWYSIDIKKNILLERFLQIHFKGSLQKALQTFYPQHKWILWKFEYEPVPPHFWDKMENQKQFMDHIGRQLKFDRMDNWYAVTSGIFISLGGKTLLQKYNNSISRAISTIYSEHKWRIWKFRTPKDYWSNKENQKEYLNWLASDLGLKNMEDWYNITEGIIAANGGSVLIRMYGSSMKLLESSFPDHNWNVEKFKVIIT